LRLLLTSGNEEAIETLTEANRTFQVVSGALYAVSAVYILAHWSRFVALCTRNWPLILLVAIVVVSAVWSVYPIVTLRRAAALVLTTGFGTYLAMRFPPQVAIKLIAWACGIAAIATLIVAAFDPSIVMFRQASSGGEVVWRGIFGAKNAMGRAMAFAVLTFVAASFIVRPAARFATIAAALLCGMLLFLSMSRAGWLSAAAALTGVPFLVLLLRSKRFSPAVRISMAALAVAIGAVLLVGLYTYGLALIGRDDSFSGRARIWDVSIRSGMKHFMTGAGYRSFWTDQGASDVYLAYLSEDSTQSLGNGHNGYLDTWLEIGAIGLGAFLLVFAVALRRVARRLMHRPDATYVWFAMILSYTFTYAWSEQILIHQSEIAWVLLVAMLFWSTPRPSKGRRSTRPAPLAANDSLGSTAPHQRGTARGVAAARPLSTNHTSHP
jgi:O-antigen ligase